MVCEKGFHEQIILGNTVYSIFLIVIQSIYKCIKGLWKACINKTCLTLFNSAFPHTYSVMGNAGLIFIVFLNLIELVIDFFHKANFKIFKFELFISLSKEMSVMTKYD